MKLTEKYCLVIRGDLAVTTARTTDSETLNYLLDRLFRGQEVAPDALKRFGLEVTVEDAPWE